MAATTGATAKDTTAGVLCAAAEVPAEKVVRALLAAKVVMARAPMLTLTLTRRWTKTTKTIRFCPSTLWRPPSRSTLAGAPRSDDARNRRTLLHRESADEARGLHQWLVGRCWHLDAGISIDAPARLHSGSISDDCWLFGVRVPQIRQPFSIHPSLLPLSPQSLSCARCRVPSIVPAVGCRCACPRPTP